MTNDTRAALRGLVEKWRARAHEHRAQNRTLLAAAYDICATELERALDAAPEPEPPVFEMRVDGIYENGHKISTLLRPPNALAISSLGMDDEEDI